MLASYNKKKFWQQIPEQPDLANRKWTVAIYVDPFAWVSVDCEEEPWEGAFKALDEIADALGSKGGPHSIAGSQRHYFFNDAYSTAAECAKHMAAALAEGPVEILKSPRLQVRRA